MIVVEASVVVDALVGAPANPELLARLADNELHAPALIDYEVASALRGHALGRRLTGARVEDAIEDFGALRIERYPLSTMMGHVLDLRDNFTVYDASYVVLARMLQVPLLTADAKLAEARRVGVEVHILQPMNDADEQA